jgi:lyso-ornithine lipid O-acyltransferase
MIRAWAKLIALVLWILIFYPLVWLAVKAKRLRISDALVRFCYQGILFICEVHLKINGQLSDGRPLLIVSNHLSYLDIPIIGSVANIRFTPKNDIASWPFIGSICKMTHCVFIDRKPGSIQDAGQAVANALVKGEIILLFPEATTGNGIHLIDFKPGFFSLAEDKIGGEELVIQPVAILYKAIRRLPIDTTQIPSIAWYGDMSLLPHLLALLKLGRIDAELALLSPVTLAQGENRKSLAMRVQNVIADKIAESRR